MEQRVLKENRLTQVRAIPQPKAGGSVPSAAWKLLEQPALAVNVQADAAIDIGDTWWACTSAPWPCPCALM